MKRGTAMLHLYREIIKNEDRYEYNNPHYSVRITISSLYDLYYFLSNKISITLLYPRIHWKELKLFPYNRKYIKSV